MTRGLWIVFLGLVSLALAGGPAYAAPAQTPVVLELFTSQGCSSCPEADATLTELSQQPGVIALAWSVDYWDYLGWPDTFAQASHSLRQRGYNQSLGRQGVYTPQMIVDGRMQVVGSRHGEIGRIIAKLRAEHPGKVAIDLVSGADGRLQARIAAASIDRPVLVRMVWFDTSRSVVVRRGENSGRTLTYTNVVRGNQVVGHYHGEAIELDLPVEDARKIGCDGVALLLEPENPGPLLGAATAKLALK